MNMLIKMINLALVLISAATVIESGSLSCNWKSYLHTYIGGNTNERIKHKTLDECKTLCSKATRFKCATIDYDRKNSICHLSVVTYMDAVKRGLIRNPENTRYDLYECTPPGLPRTCADVTDTNQTRVRIDPDGESGRIRPFEVECDFSSNPPATIVNLIDYFKKRRCLTRCEYTEDEYTCAERFMVYDGVQTYQAKVLAAVSQRCEQSFKYECHGAMINNAGKPGSYPYTGWRSNNGYKQKYFPGGPTHGGCACKKTNSCAGNKLCNCDMNDLKWREDQGVVTDKSVLPIGSLFFDDLADKQQGCYSIGPLKCY